jgi:anthranilate synthase/aminodeoxychorismate synthase-like glutamine amidotransferase
LGAEVEVFRNDRIGLEEIKKMTPEAIFLSPGPCTPKEAGITVEVIRTYHQRFPMLGVCLGHQAIGYAFGGNIVRADRLMHGKTSRVRSDGKTIYRGLPNPFVAGRYHSLLLEKNSVPDCLMVTAETEEGEIMGVRHREYPVEGIQFHPESILTPNGKRIIKNFLDGLKEKGDDA